MFPITGRKSTRTQNQFLEDMARYEEQRQINQHEVAYRADLDQIKDLQKAPHIDDLSK